jgi:hypothetical protein
MVLLDQSNPFGRLNDRSTAPTQFGQSFVPQPVSQGLSTLAAMRGPMTPEGHATGPPRLEDHRREDAGHHGRFGPDQEIRGQRLGHQEIGLVVDVGQPVPRRCEGPPIDIPQLLEDSNALAQLA